jgi:hypothetical protein
MKYAVAKLEGALLNQAVARAEGWPDGAENFHPQKNSLLLGMFNPSADWSHGGPLIDRYDISVIKEAWRNDDIWFAAVNVEFGVHERADHRMSGPTPLIAAMRTRVASKFGEEVDL